MVGLDELKNVAKINNSEIEKNGKIMETDVSNKNIKTGALLKLNKESGDLELHSEQFDEAFARPLKLQNLLAIQLTKFDPRTLKFNDAYHVMDPSDLDNNIGHKITESSLIQRFDTSDEEK
jgi:benzoyl-CoA reductase/2-hydroxyglutaryl-CoA dehydratase subunit BcrC/BadD/HgdB